VRVVITGGAGFLGSHLADVYIAEGHEVIVLDNLITGSMDNIAHLRENERFTFVLHDVSKHIDVDGPVDLIFHFACPASPKDFKRYPIQILKVDSLGTHNTLGLAKAKGARYLIASTSEVYGDPEVHPQREDYWGNVNPIGIRGAYDETKRFAEAMTMAYYRMHNIDTRIVRIFNTYGPRMGIDDGRVLPNLITQAMKGNDLTVYGDGSQTRSFCYVDDLIRGIKLLAEQDDFHEPVNIGNPNEVTILEFAREILDLTGSKSKIKFMELPPDDPKKRKPDIGRAHGLLGWEPRIERRDGLAKTLEYFKLKLKQTGDIE